MDGPGVDRDAPPLQMEDGCKSLDGKPILRHMNLRLGRGETLVLLGRSGCGKSVLLKCLSGLMKLDEGSVRLLGRDVQDASSGARDTVRGRVGFLFQGAAIYDSLSVRENLEFHIRRQLKIRDAGEMEALVRSVLGDVGLEDAAEKMPSELSGGMRKRLGLARSLVSRPDLMFYDEPTTGLDPVTSMEVSRLIRQTQEARGVASIVVTHDMRCARTTADRVMILDGGSAYAEGSYGELEASGDDAVRAFFQ